MGRGRGAGGGGAAAGTAPAERDDVFLSLGLRCHLTGHTPSPRPLFDRSLTGRIHFITFEGNARAWAMGLGLWSASAASMGLSGQGRRWGRGVGVPGALGPQF